MKYFFLLLTKEEAASPINVGYKFIKEHKDRWEKAPSEIEKYLTAGFVNGVDFAAKGDKAYFIRKAYILIDEDAVIILCAESVQGADVIEN